MEIARLELDSPAVAALREAGVALVVPLVTQGELIGTLNLGPRLSEQDYSTDDRRLLTTLAAQAAPAIRVAQLVREQAAEAAERERLEQEMRVATLIQQQFLPRELPKLPQWQIAAYYGPARAVGGDFYDFIELRDGRIGIVVGDVTDKGVPGRAGHGPDPLDPPRRGQPRATHRATILARANDAARARDAGPHVRDLPVRDPRARDGPDRHGQCGPQPALHPDGRRASSSCARRACRSGCMPGIQYEETEGVIAPGSNVLLYSDGLVEAHDPTSEMYGFPRLREAMAVDDAGSELLDRLLDDAPPVHRRRLGAGGRHHARHPAPRVRRGR